MIKEISFIMCGAFKSLLDNKLNNYCIVHNIKNNLLLFF